MIAKNLFKETCVKKTRLYKGRSVNFYNDIIRLPNKKTANREYMDHPGAVGVLAFLDPKRIVLVKQYRYPVGQATLEIPAGKLDPGENPLPCVIRETQEEAGYTPRQIKKLISYWPTPAFSNEVLHIYTATKLVPCAAHPDDDEFLQTTVLPIQQALRLVKSGLIQDSKTVVALLAYSVFIKSLRT